MVYTLTYVSKASPGVNTDDLKQILEVARDFNKSRDITGMLLYKEGEFMQTLEGDEHEVTQLYDHITKDKRHSQCQIICRKERPERLFSDWTMGFKEMNNEELLQQEGVTSFFEINYDNNEFLQSATAYNLMIRFYNK